MPVSTRLLVPWLHTGGEWLIWPWCIPRSLMHEQPKERSCGCLASSVRSRHQGSDPAVAGGCVAASAHKVSTLHLMSVSATADQQHGLWLCMERLLHPPRVDEAAAPCSATACAAVSWGCCSNGRHKSSRDWCSAVAANGVKCHERQFCRGAAKGGTLRQPVCLAPPLRDRVCLLPYTTGG